MVEVITQQYELQGLKTLKVNFYLKKFECLSNLKNISLVLNFTQNPRQLKKLQSIVKVPKFKLKH